MKDGSDAIADWPILNALINTAAGAHWVSVHHGGGVGIGYSIHAGMVVVADGTDDARDRLERVLTTDPGMGVIRHADAGYERALEVARGARRPDPHARTVTERHIVAMGGGQDVGDPVFRYVGGSGGSPEAEGVSGADGGERGPDRGDAVPLRRSLPIASSRRTSTSSTATTETSGTSSARRT